MCYKKLQGSINIKKEKEEISDDLREMQLEYYIVESDMENELPLSYGKRYGIEIVKKEYTVNNDTYIENKLIDDICCSENNAKELVNKLIHNAVTPVSLNCVLEDLVGVV